ncbi:hypothetical protein P691DRAFT_803582 [Macrolepiota fuliginosa MF-IS2]|uniref:HTH TFE/IIEalpha-type domain-containing protein n=1 Tax=Macrolepiota fuliginosa MF-IS2 TaxID=1400762 RepID=A0A9P6C2H5_9AGAR|nr:hypothetical protein P691DRAFT_803582 [Macrolepiota fuliginosa MF-IS2]
MGLQPKELNKVIAVLNNDCLVKVYRQNELKEGAQRSVGKQYYYIDYQHFCNVVKWRVAKMRLIIDSSLRNELDNKGYVCTLCKQSYSPLDADKLMDFMRGMMACEICHAEVVDNENAESVQGSKDRMQRFNHQMRFIREGLQKSEAMVLPAFDVAAWVKTHTTDTSSQKSSSAHPGGPGLKVAGSDPNAKQTEEGIGIMMAMDKDEAQRRQERAAEAELKRQQNALPAWHLKSTITGDLTALGIKENKRAEAAAAAMSGGGGSNDEILRGLGIVGISAPKSGAGANGSEHGSGMGNDAVEDEKLTLRQDDADYYEQYYASLAASTNVSEQPTPTPTATGNSNPSEFGSEYMEEEEEDRKPNVEFLDSLNEYRKRSRSKEDDGSALGVGSKAAKVAKVEVNGAAVNGHANGVVNGIGNGFNGVGHGNGSAAEESLGLGVNGYGYEDANMADGYSNGGGTELDDPIIYVNGNPVPYSKVTEEDHELMTPDEYTAFFEIMQTRS